MGKRTCLVGTLTVAGLIGLIWAEPAMAGRCSGASDPIFCDDFDSWCTSPPPWPTTCLWDSATDQAGFLAHWPQVEGSCGASEGRYAVVQDHMWSIPFAVIARQNQDIQKLARHAHDMTDEILAHPDNTEGKVSINGSGVILSYDDPNYVDPRTIPEVLKGFFFVWLGNYTLGAYPYMTFYTELYLGEPVGSGRAPVDFTVTDCYPEAQGPYQIVQASDGNQHPSFAFGMLAYLDPIPCSNHGGSDRRPQLERAVVFDGLNWIQLKDYADSNADFRLDDSWNRFYYCIGEAHIEVRLYNTRARTESPNGEYFVARIERQYPGPFNTIALGAPKGRDVGPGECKGPGGLEQCYGGMNDGQSCSTAADCPPYEGTCVGSVCVGGTNHDNGCATDDQCPDAENTPVCLDAPKISNNAYVDDVVLYEAVFQGGEAEGACCLPDLSCIETTQENCEVTLGGDYNGNFTTCAGVLCCADPFADADVDGDVDQDDFAVFQACITGAAGGILPGCACFDREPDTDVDQDDLGNPTLLDTFEGCASGPDVPADPTCDDPI